MIDNNLSLQALGNCKSIFFIVRLILNQSLMRFSTFIVSAFITTNSFAQPQFKKYHPCSFFISLPRGFTIKPIEKESNFDYCDYKVKTADKVEVMQLHSLLASRYMDSDQNAFRH